ncbi:MAG: non-canonical purine NTP pyrophosphatase [Cellulosilyticaceae bacterium]
MLHNALFISTHENKKIEMKRIFKNLGQEISVQGWGDIEDIQELQTNDLQKLIEDKLTKIYASVKRPVIVEHTTLQIHHLNGYPNTQTKLFWGKLKADKVCQLIPKGWNKNRSATVETMIGYCDGKNMFFGKGSTEGRITYKPHGKKEFDWDTIFIPSEQGNKLTFAQLEAREQKDKFSMRARAAKNLLNNVQEQMNGLEEEDNTYLYDIGLKPSICEDIKSQIRDQKLVLFVGAGVSANAKLPTWGQLIKQMGQEIGYNPDVFTLLGDYLELAEYYKIKAGPDKKDVEEYFKNIETLEVEKAIKNSEIYECITKLGVRTIYTTNYEHLIELAYKLHKPEQTVHTVYDLETLNQCKQEDIKVVKFHGDIEKPENLVLTQSSYYKRYDFENIMDIMLRNDLLDKSILFLGYGFGDENLKYMFYKLNTLWSKEEIKQRPKCYLFMTHNNPIQRMLWKENYNIETIVPDELDRAEGLTNFLKQLTDPNKVSSDCNNNHKFLVQVNKLNSTKSGGL